jgi:Ca-activated chloride channel family protein
VDTAESWFNQGDALAYLKKYSEAVEAHSEALKRRPDWRDAKDNLTIVKALIPPPPKEGKGKKGLVNAPGQQSADVWMRSLQVNPADFLRRKFAIESEKGRGR